MRLGAKDVFLKQCIDVMGSIFDLLNGLQAIKLRDLDAEKTAFVIVDMVNGFARKGALKSPRVEALIPEITRLSAAFDSAEIKKIAFADCHSDASPEFSAYPVHCIEGSSEGEIVDEIKEIGGYLLLAKNSTNGFLEEKFQKWLAANGQIDTFILVGDCTDICIEQFAVTLKAYFNMNNAKSRVIVPINGVDTYDLGTHNADIMNVIAFYTMMNNGVELVAGVEV